eukprot:TRINITY_DN20607_c0_g1_i1.p1 TRINITY_DN20607_c0_g1~~TRINITY_DN20607_c0_g1_i1.p1  ORF type:complete len:183 (+),score=31.86 TRINITY_DN20607_c0_g1_i1:49-549(+)
MSLPEIVAEVIGSLTERPERSGSPMSSVSSCEGGECIYDGKRERGIGIKEYLQRWKKYAHKEDEIILLGMIYFDRCCVRTGIEVTKLNVHRLLFACLVLAAKWSTDHPYTNGHYAAVGGVTVRDLNALERQLLTDVNFATHVEAKHLRLYKKEFLRHTVTEESRRR